jgi:hypothetical protein
MDHRLVLPAGVCLQDLKPGTSRVEMLRALLHPASKRLTPRQVLARIVSGGLWTSNESSASVDAASASR